GRVSESPGRLAVFISPVGVPVNPRHLSWAHRPADRLASVPVLRVGAAGLAPRAMARTGVSLLGLLSLLLLAACRSPFAAPTPLGQRTLQVSVLTSDVTAPTSLPAGQAIVDFTFDSNPGSEERISCDGTALAQVT